MRALLFLLLLIGQVIGRQALVSVFSDGGIGAGGTFLDRYPVQVNVQGRRVRVFPAAVHSSKVSAYKYKVLRVRRGNRIGYVHIVDECGSGDCHGNHAKAKGALLIDIHRSAMRTLGLKWTLQRAQFAVVGKVPLGKIPRAVVSGGAKKGYLDRKWQ